MNDHESLQGFSKLVSAFHAGKQYEPADAGTLSQFFGNRFRHIRTRMSSRFELVPEASPKGMDLVQVSKRFVVGAIYGLEGKRCGSGNRRVHFILGPPLLTMLLSCRYISDFAAECRSRGE